VVLSFVLGAIACAFTALCYAEMAAALPVGGSAYTYAYAALGELVAWIIGWDLILEYVMGGTTVAIGWSGYFVSFARDYGLDVPARFAAAPLVYDPVRHAWALTGAIANVPAMVAVIFLNSLLVVGIRQASRFNNVIVAVKLIVIGLFIVCAAPAVSTAHWVTTVNPTGAFIPPNAGAGLYGWSGVVLRRSRDILRLYRIRCGLHSGAGSQESQA
jgi:basic amino acid/polyamine antiporter, APA family